MKILLIVIGIVVFLIAAAAVIGAFLPKQHEVSRSVVIETSPETVYRALTAFASAPSWRSDVKRVEILEPVLGRVRFREHGEHGAVTYEVTQDEPARLLVTEIVDRDLGYSGSWTYALAPEGAGTRLTITERGEVSNVMFRFLSRFVFGHTATMEKYLAALAAHVR